MPICESKPSVCPTCQCDRKLFTVKQLQELYNNSLNTQSSAWTWHLAAVVFLHRRALHPNVWCLKCSSDADHTFYASRAVSKGQKYSRKNTFTRRRLQRWIAGTYSGNLLKISRIKCLGPTEPDSPSPWHGAECMDALYSETSRLLLSLWILLRHLLLLEAQQQKKPIQILVLEHPVPIR